MAKFEVNDTDRTADLLRFGADTDRPGYASFAVQGHDIGPGDQIRYTDGDGTTEVDVQAAWATNNHAASGWGTRR